MLCCDGPSYCRTRRPPPACALQNAGPAGRQPPKLLLPRQHAERRQLLLQPPPPAHCCPRCQTKPHPHPAAPPAPHNPAQWVAACRSRRNSREPAQALQQYTGSAAPSLHRAGRQAADAVAPSPSSPSLPSLSRQQPAASHNHHRHRRRPGGPHTRCRHSRGGGAAPGLLLLLRGAFTCG